MPTWIAGLIAVAALVAMLAAVQRAHDRHGIDSESTRRLAHVLGALAAACLPAFMPMRTVAIVAFVFVIVMLVSSRRGSLAAVHAVTRRSWGAWCFPLAIGVLALAGPTTEQYVFGVLTMGLGDAAANFVGQRWGTHRLPLRLKHATFEGSAAFVAVVLAVGVVMVVVVVESTSAAALGPLLMVAFALAVLEASTPLGLDNLVLPLTAAALWEWLIV